MHLYLRYSSPIMLISKDYLNIILVWILLECIAHKVIEGASINAGGRTRETHRKNTLPREGTDKLSHIPTLVESETRTHTGRGEMAVVFPWCSSKCFSRNSYNKLVIMDGETTDKKPTPFADGASNISIGTSSASSNNIISVTGYTGTGKMTFQISYYEQRTNWLSAYTTCQTRKQGELLQTFNITQIRDIFRSNNIDNTTEVWTSIIYPINSDGGVSSWFDAYSCKSYLDFQQPNDTTDACLTMTVGERSEARLCTDNRSFACVLNTEPFIYHVGMDVSPESVILFLVDHKIVTANECREFCVNREACIAFTAYTNVSSCMMYSLTNTIKKIIEYNITNGLQNATHAIKNHNTFNVKPDMPLPANLTFPSCPQSGAITVPKTVLPSESSTEMNTSTAKPPPSESIVSSSVQFASVSQSSQTYTNDKSLRYSYLITASSSVFLEKNSLLGHGLIESISTDAFSGPMYIYSTLSPSYVITVDSNTIHAQYTPCASLPASQQLSLTHTIIDYSLSTIATTFVLESSYAYLQNLGTKCSCQFIETSLVSLSVTKQQIKENIEKMKEELQIDRKSTNTYIRGLTSADDKRISARTIGASAVVILIGLLLAVVILDLNNFYQSGLIFLDNVRDLFPRNMP